MATLLLRLSSPLQAWGVSSKFDTRYTEKMPTKSGLIGLLAAALGLTRDSDITQLSSQFRFGFRADREGTVIRDFQKIRIDDKKSGTKISNRYYLSDAMFLAAVEGDRESLDNIVDALRCPFFPLYLGRRSCPPEGKLILGIRDENIEDVLANEPCLDDSKAKAKDVRLRVQLEADSSDDGVFYQKDLPLSFDFANRQYGYRALREYWVTPSSAFNVGKETRHDPFTLLGDEESCS